jgi:hypothetical protein
MQTYHVPCNNDIDCLTNHHPIIIQCSNFITVYFLPPSWLTLQSFCSVASTLSPTAPRGTNLRYLIVPCERNSTPFPAIQWYLRIIAFAQWVFSAPLRTSFFGGVTSMQVHLLVSKKRIVSHHQPGVSRPFHLAIDHS